MSWRLATGAKNILRSSATRSSARITWSRNAHTRKALPYSVEAGLGEFLPPQALQTIAVEYQSGLLERLNDEVRGTENENCSVAQTVINTAPFREKTLAFNYASLALNNSFFLEHLAPLPAGATNHEGSISSGLMQAIRNSYPNLEELKSEFSAAALGMSSSGWVWCVLDSTGDLGITITLGPGSLLVRSRSHMPHDKGAIIEEPLRGESPLSSLSTQPTSPVSGIPLSGNTQGPSGTQIRSLHSSAPASNYPFNTSARSIYDIETAYPRSAVKPQSKSDFINVGKTLYPLFCVSVHEHAWMSAGYGIWGKEEWLKKFWTVLDWQKISRSYDRYSSRV